MLVSTIWLGRIPFFRIFLGFIELLSKIAEEVIQHRFPLGPVIRNLIQLSSICAVKS